MSKKKKNSKVFYLSSIDNTLRQMPKYNAYQGGYGPHGSKGYNRRKEKGRFQKELRNEVL